MENTAQNIQFMAFDHFLNLVQETQNKSTKNKKSDLQSLAQQEEYLVKMANELKTEFVGLDYQIDQLITTLRPWYLMPEALRRPLVVTLWGMTGVGKTTLVQRLVEKLKMKDRFCIEDIGKHVDQSRDMSGVENLVFKISFLSGTPSVLFFDEIQTARTLDDGGHEIDRPNLRDFWTLLDTGKIQAPLYYIRDMRMNFSERLKMYQKNPPMEGDRVVSPFDLSPLLSYFAMGKELAQAFFAAADEEPLKVLDWVVRRLEQLEQSPPVYDFSKSLIILAGNIDEAYTNVHSVDPTEMTADELYENLKNVGAAQIKAGLLNRFRAEQVARMGTSLVIFPSLSQKSYEALIQRNLAQLEDRLRQEFLINFTFHPSIHDLILKKGVIPSQGARPVLSTIAELIESRIPIWLLAAAKKECLQCEVRFSWEKSTFELHSHGQVIHSDILKFEVKQTSFAESPEILIEYAAHHEAGHLVVGTCLYGMLPTRVIFGEGLSNKVPPQVRFNSAPVLTKQIAQNTLSVGLAGYAAELMMYGENGVSSSALRDLSGVTELASQMISELAMGGHVGVSLSHPELVHNLSSLKTKDDLLKERWLKKALVHSKKELKKQWLFFQKISEVLKTELRLPRERLEEIFMEYYKAPKAEKEKILARKFDQTFESKKRTA